jgi:hypothetical protein
MKECNEPFCKDHNQKMSPENCKLVQAAVKEAGAFLEGKLPPFPPHLNMVKRERNSYAHLWERIRSKMGKSYKDCTDAQLEEILQIVAFHRENPS